MAASDWGNTLYGGKWKRWVNNPESHSYEINKEPASHCVSCKREYTNICHTWKYWMHPPEFTIIYFYVIYCLVEMSEEQDAMWNKLSEEHFY